MWHSRNRFYRVHLEKKGFSRIHVELNGEVEQLSGWNTHQAAFQRLSMGADLGYDEVYENEHKNHILGQANYSRGALGLCDRSAWSDNDGRRLPKPELRVLPSPCWVWAEDWHVETAAGTTDDEGWVYAFRWGSHDWKAEKSFGKFVRRRRWIRFRRERTLQQDADLSKSSVCSPKSEPRKSFTRNTDAALIYRISEGLQVSNTVQLENIPDDVVNLKFANYRLSLFEVCGNYGVFLSLGFKVSSPCRKMV